MCVCVPECMYVQHMYVCASVSTRGCLHSLELGSYVVVRHQVWVLGTKLTSSVKATSVLNVEPSLQTKKKNYF